MIIGIGTDIIEIGRIKKAIQTRPKMVERIFTRAELDYCQGTGNLFASLAARFAAKEAVVKALGTGFRDYKWQDIEIINNHLGKPSVEMHGKAREKAQELRVANIHISISHCREYAVAMVILERG
ncbi:MAG: holo-[acyl-carrier protein] synthase [Clostridia bacterium]|jgi:holo-[acyl-carrier protein] synthase|nr:holo-[acyl-carrier protein] synthase [Clostridia bacterium]MDN5324110.1 holo-[acyl-carrier protein] synthase [Clostridia bacterium]